jgi:hypothetical protein
MAKSDQVPFFETQNAVEKPNTKNVNLERGEPLVLHSNFKLEKEEKADAPVRTAYFWTKSIYVERTVNETQSHHLLIYNDQKQLQNALVWARYSELKHPEPESRMKQQLEKELVKYPKNEDFLNPNSIELFTFGYSKAGKINSIKLQVARHWEDYETAGNQYELREFKPVAPAPQL